MASKKPGGRKKRVDFRPNRQQQHRSDEWTRRYRAEEDALIDERNTQSVRAKGELSRRRTVVVDEQDAPIVDEAQWQRGVVTVVYGLVSRVEDEAGRPWECTVRRVLRTLLIAERAPVAVGDRVWFSDQSRLHDGASAGVIERVEPRRTALSRREFRGRQHTLVANADQLLIVASVAQPNLKPHLIDRYLIAAAKGDLRPIIAFHKCDLLEDPVAAPESAFPTPVTREDRPADDETADEDDEGGDETLTVSLDDVIAEYEALGYCCIPTSIRDGRGLERLRAELTGRVTVLSGQSGVGKSSLINAVQPGLDLAVQEVSRENEKGRHTTTHARLLRLDFGGYVVDTPGIRQFDLWAVEPGELEVFFIEFGPFLSQCRFKDCHHRNEQGCAVVAAVDAGRISTRRYLSYLKTLDELGQERRQRYS